MTMQVENMVIMHLVLAESGSLRTTRHRVNYLLKDDVDPRIAIGGEIDINDLAPSDTIQEWYDSVVNQIKTYEGI